ncbi:MAG: hypothetical protein GWN53_17120 [Gammaproteobacteria bacterium]|uniref:Uncharacterized protein n=1 Tax=Candidatus Kutchimonas denitrificans TaxID=3056748 RepID=A0AAE4ZCA6_9BACT|nr:hypothetical protein [Candidatus Kutchimonas denitrificans]NIV53563.1 hypothetical protein [Gammaproteobacteria bacterium]
MDQRERLQLAAQAGTYIAKVPELEERIRQLEAAVAKMQAAMRQPQTSEEGGDGDEG